MSSRSAIDPLDGDAIGAALVDLVATSLDVGEVELAAPLSSPGAGMSTFIWFAELTGPDLPPEWRQPLVLRIHRDASEAEVNAREAAVQAFVVAAGYPAPRPIVVDSAPEDDRNPFRLPFTIMPRAPGTTVLDAITSKPWQTKALLDEMVDLQVRLQRIPIDGCPLPYDEPLVDRMLAKLEKLRTEGGWDELRPRLAWLVERADVVREEEVVLGHNDFHPLNVMVDVDADRGPERMVVIDWTDAALGDRTYDVSRTLLLFWVAPMVASGSVERVALRAARGWLARTYRRAYERELPLDDARVLYWQVVHLVRGQMQALALRSPGDAAAPRTAAADAVPPGLADGLGRRAAELSERFDRLT